MIMNLDTKLSRHIEEALKKGASAEELFKHFKVKQKEIKHKDAPFNSSKFFWITSLVFVLYALSNPELYQTPKEFIEDLKEKYLISWGDKCLIGMTAVSLELTRPISNCNICRGISEVSYIYCKQKSPEKFILIVTKLCHNIYDFFLINATLFKK